MEKRTKPTLPDAFLWLKDLPKEPAAERFTAQQMSLCEACGRGNAPTRLACLYCGVAMKIAAENAALARPVLRRLETWEKGWNVFYLPNGERENSDEVKLAQIADFLRLDRAEFEKILVARHVLPVAQAESETEAVVVQKHLELNGFRTTVVSDVDLEIKVSLRRVRRLEFADHNLNLNLIGKTDEKLALDPTEIELLVVGAIFERQVENREQRKGKNAFEIKDSRELSSDEQLIDFYVKNDKTGYRISAKNFDFSCLGAEKKMLAHENFKILLEKLKGRARNAILDDSYKNLRAALNPIWQPDHRNESLGWQHEGIGKISIDNRLTVNNSQQFLRYSRMLRDLRNKTEQS